MAGDGRVLTERRASRRGQRQGPNSRNGFLAAGRSAVRTISRFSSLQPQACGDDVPAWFLHRGYLVVMPLRRGYGATGGPDSTALAAGPHGVQRCDDVQHALTGLEAARDIATALDSATVLPGARPDSAVVLGISTGGYAAMASTACPVPRWLPSSTFLVAAADILVADWARSAVPTRWRRVRAASERRHRRLCCGFMRRTEHGGSC